MNAVQIFAYAAVVFCATAIAVKMVRIARMPVHLRWDLYPIPHEKGRGSYGGSYYEEVDWWTKPRGYSLAAELKAMALEIFLVHSLFRHNRALWLVSYPFHFGLYSLVVFALLLLAGGVLVLSGLDLSPVDAYFQPLLVVVGTAGWVLTIVGAAGLWLSRLIRPELRQASIRSDYFNLAFLLAVSAAGFVAWYTSDPAYAVLRRLVADMLAFRDVGAIPTAVTVQVGLMSALLFYFPFTHMTHMFSKFFTYHSVRWEDHPNIRGGKIEKAVTEALGHQLTWAAPHVRKGSWADAVTDGKQRDHD